MAVPLVLLKKLAWKGAQPRVVLAVKSAVSCAYPVRVYRVPISTRDHLVNERNRAGFVVFFTVGRNSFECVEVSSFTAVFSLWGGAVPAIVSVVAFKYELAPSVENE